MDLSMSVLLTNLVSLFLLIGIGFLSAKMKLVPDTVSGPITSVLLRVALPALIFSAAVKPIDGSFLRDGLQLLLIGTVAHTAYAVISWFLSGLLRVPDDRRGMWTVCCTFSNNGFMGYPILAALFGDKGVSFNVLLSIPWNLFVFSAGPRLVVRDDPEKRSSLPPISIRGCLLTPCNYALVAGFACSFLKIPLPACVLSPIDMLGDVTTPLSMFVIGMTLAQGNFMEVIRDRDAWTASLNRLIVLPLLTWLVLRMLPIANPMVVGVVFLVMSMPAPAIGSILAEQYGGNAVLASRTVFLSSLLCIITLPLMMLLL